MRMYTTKPDARHQLGFMSNSPFPIVMLQTGRVGGGRGGCRSRELLLPAAFALLPVPQSRPWLRFPPPLIEPDLRISRIRLSDGLHERACTGLRLQAHLMEVDHPHLPVDLGEAEAAGSSGAACADDRETAAPEPDRCLLPIREAKTASSLPRTTLFSFPASPRRPQFTTPASPESAVRHINIFTTASPRRLRARENPPIRKTDRLRLAGPALQAEEASFRQSSGSLDSDSLTHPRTASRAESPNWEQSAPLASAELLRRLAEGGDEGLVSAHEVFSDPLGRSEEEWRPACGAPAAGPRSTPRMLDNSRRCPLARTTGRRKWRTCPAPTPRMQRRGPACPLQDREVRVKVCAYPGATPQVARESRCWQRASSRCPGDSCTLKGARAIF